MLMHFRKKESSLLVFPVLVLHSRGVLVSRWFKADLGGVPQS